MNCAVVVVTFNRLELLKECLEKLRRQTYPFSHVIVVDNHSTDGTREYLKQLTMPGFSCCFQKKNYGGAGGFYYGLKKAVRMQTDWVLLIDDDAMLRKDYLEKLVHYIERYPQAAAVSGTVMCHGKIDIMHRRNLTHPLLFLEQAVPREQYGKEAFSYELSTFCGLMVKKSVIERIGLPRKDFFLWYDDTEYSLRLRACGGIQNVNAAKLDHKTKEAPGGNFVERIGWKSYYGYRNRYVTAKEHGSRGTLIMVYLEFYVFLLLVLCHEARKGSWKGAKKKARILLDAMQDGIRGRLNKNESYQP